MPQRLPLNIVYEDGDLLVVDKPAGLTVHPGPGHPDGTLANAVLAHCPDLQGIGGTVRPGIVHRLDKDTSGLMVVAKNDHTHRSLSEQLKARSFTKEYIALTHGSVTPAEAIIDAPNRALQRQPPAHGGRGGRTRCSNALSCDAPLPCPHARRGSPHDRAHAPDTRPLRINRLSTGGRFHLWQARQQAKPALPPRIYSGLRAPIRWRILRIYFPTPRQNLRNICDLSSPPR